MKKFVVAILCLMLFVTAAVPVSAAAAHMSLDTSADTVHRGETFTITVSLSNDQPVSNGGVVLSYDSSAFELLGGSCNVANAILGEVSASNGGGVFMLQADAVVSGTVFTINMRVKDNASFGSYTISGTPSLNISCSLSGTSVTVACNHSFGGSTKVDDSSHESVCAVCGEKKRENHSWDGGTVTKPATCKDPGSKNVKCTGCGATKTETVPVTNDHKYSPWSSVSNFDHSRKCSVCGKEEKTAHTWNSGEIIEWPTCQAAGYQILTCTGCGGTLPEDLGPIDHLYDNAVSAGETGHTYSCVYCGLEGAGDHVFSEPLEHDKNWHFQSCDACGYQHEQSAHVPGPAATETADQVCTVCNRILQPMGKHVHKFAAQWVSDKSGHWQECDGCSERNAAAPHKYDSDCDPDCNICTHVRTVAHKVTEEWNADEAGHWKNCGSCGEKVNAEAHIPGDAATITAPQVCTACSFEIAPVVPHDHVFDADGGRHVHVCACGAEYEADGENCEICAPYHKQFPWWIVCIAEAVVFGGVFGFLFLRGKKKKVKYDCEY